MSPMNRAYPRQVDGIPLLRGCDGLMSCHSTKTKFDSLHTTCRDHSLDEVGSLEHKGEKLNLKSCPKCAGYCRASPTAGSVMDYTAHQRLGIVPETILPDTLGSARVEIDLVFVQWYLDR